MALAISNVTGTITDGQSITITGTDFGATGPTIILFDDFEGYNAGTTLSSESRNAKVGAWDAHAEIEPAYPVYSANYAHGGTRSMLSTMADYDGNYWAAVAFTASTKVFVSFWVYLPSDKSVPYTELGGYNWKLADVNADAYPAVSSQYTVCVAIGDLPTGENQFESPGSWSEFGVLTDGGYCTTSWAKGRWHRFDAYYVGSTGTSGADYLWEVDSETSYTNRWSQTGMYNLLEEDASGWTGFRLNSYARGPDANTACYYDDVYVATGDGARARVEIGNNATYANCTNLAVCTPTAWGDTEITATVRMGSFTTGTAYLFVVDANGNASAGKEITLGSVSTNFCGSSASSILGLSVGSIGKFLGKELN